MNLRLAALPLAQFAVSAPYLSQAQSTPIRITADLTDATRKLFHAEVDIPVTAGTIDLTTPKWIPGDKAQLFPGQKIIAVNGNIFSTDALKAAIQQSKGATEPIHLIMQSDTFVTSADIDYHDGERYPTLVRVAGTPAYLDDITRPLTIPEKTPDEGNGNNPGR